MHRRRRCAACGPDLLGAGVHGQSAIHPRDVPPWGRSGAASSGARSSNWTGVSRELLARAWAAGAGPGDTPLTIDLDSTI